METKEAILQRIKDEVANEYGWKNWSSAYGDNGITNRLIDETANRYSIAMCNEQIKSCASIADHWNYNEVLKTKNVSE